MMRKYIRKKIKDTVIKRACGCCEYCKALASHTPSPFEVEHIIALVLGGDDTLENLAYACRGCNLHKGVKIAILDPKTGKKIPLFHPRKDQWNNHFKWDDDTLRIVGITLKGELTIQKLDMNREGLVNLRQLLKNAGLHPPK